MPYYKNNNNVVIVCDNIFKKQNEEFVEITEDEAIDLFKISLTNLKNSNEYKIQEAKEYLNSTDYKMLPDYNNTDDYIVAKRQEAREFIRANKK